MNYPCKTPLLGCLVLTSLSIGCASANSKATWTSIVARCAKNDTVKKTVYFGPSNVVGPGSLWRKTPDGYNVRDLLSGLEPSDDGRKKLVLEGSVSTCQGTSSQEFSAGAKVDLESKLAPASAGLSADLKRASKVVVNVNGWSWDQILEGPFEKTINGAPTSSYVTDLVKEENRRVLNKAVRIAGFDADLTFSTAVAGELKGKYKDSLGQLGDSDLSAKVSLKWVNDTTLKISSPNPFYVAGTFIRWRGDGAAGPAKSAFSPEPLAKGARVATDAKGK